MRTMNTYRVEIPWIYAGKFFGCLCTDIEMPVLVGHLFAKSEYFTIQSLR